ncbi:hypothetical protein Cgig2_021651 [Carnegiea gigantea]|uniref:Uncharacterized protein n=1 Tax=Carnegiea gigantea TaxID=171969 RepID=A0A9Q1K9Y7_9CARY|nr:hypothetical protein Cgig2_021651 [Carnegiea gigantea]
MLADDDVVGCLMVAMEMKMQIKGVESCNLQTLKSEILNAGILLSAPSRPRLLISLSPHAQISIALLGSLTALSLSFSLPTGRRQLRRSDPRLVVCASAQPSTARLLDCSSAVRFSVSRLLVPVGLDTGYPVVKPVPTSSGTRSKISGPSSIEIGTSSYNSRPGPTGTGIGSSKTDRAPDI